MAENGHKQTIGSPWTRLNLITALDPNRISLFHDCLSPRKAKHPSSDLLMIATQKINWSRTLAEGAAILASILLAFWIDAWWDVREEDELSHGYLLGLREDFTQLESELGKHIDFIAGVIKNANKVLTMASGPDSELLSGSFSQAMGSTYSIRAPNLATPTYHDMINSGSLRLVKNPTLRMKIAELASLLQEIDKQKDVINETYWLHHAPFIDKHFVLSEFGWWNSPTNDNSKELFQIIGEPLQAPFEIEVAAVRTRQFWNLIYDWTTVYGDQLGPSIEAKNLCRELLVILVKEIGEAI